MYQILIVSQRTRDTLTNVRERSKSQPSEEKIHRRDYIIISVPDYNILFFSSPALRHCLPISAISYLTLGFSYSRSRSYTQDSACCLGKRLGYDLDVHYILTTNNLNFFFQPWRIRRCNIRKAEEGFFCCFFFNSLVLGMMTKYYWGYSKYCITTLIHNINPLNKPMWVHS